MCRNSAFANHHGATHPQISTFQSAAFLRTVSRHVHLHRAFDRQRRALGRGTWHSVCMVYGCLYSLHDCPCTLTQAGESDDCIQACLFCMVIELAWSTNHSLSIFSTFQVPLLTVRGQTFASRVAATLVENAGVSVELVVHTKQDCTSMFSFSTRVCFLFF